MGGSSCEREPEKYIYSDRKNPIIVLSSNITNVPCRSCRSLQVMTYRNGPCSTTNKGYGTTCDLACADEWGEYIAAGIAPRRIFEDLQLWYQI